MDKKLDCCRIKKVTCVTLSAALDNLKTIIAENEQKGVKTVIFCEDRLTLVAERTICAAVGGTFSASVYTFARFMTAENGKSDNVLSSRGSAMTVRKIIEDNKDKLTLFKKLSAADSAGAVYDTIALLYASRISAEEVAKASERGGFLGGKLKDVALIYSEYSKYLEENGLEDRNAYLKRLSGVIEKSDKIRGNCVIFLGFQALTCTALECVRACFGTAASVYGLFIGGAEDIYVNEAGASFSKAAEEFGGAEERTDFGSLVPEAEVLRRRFFNPESYFLPAEPTDKVSVYEAADFGEELEFIAANIKRHVIDEGERYAKISVMLPDLESCEGELARVFARYKIPYYADRQFSLSSHPISLFTVNYLICALTGCRQKEVISVVSSPLFPADGRDKDIFRNYILRFCTYRAAVKRQPSPEVLQNAGMDIDAVERVREKFLEGLKLLPAADGRGAAECVQALYERFGVSERLKELSEKFADERPNASAFYARAYDSAISVLNEAKSITGGGVPLSEFIKILKSGFAAMKISIIPPKADAVFVGDLITTVNAGSNVVFAGNLTGDVPSATSDASLLTDKEIAALESVNLNISPKIKQVNDRKRETVALNLCAFRKRLYLISPVRLGGEECERSEIISYAKRAFKTPLGQELSVTPISRLDRSPDLIPFYCSEKLPALERLKKYEQTSVYSAIYAVLCEKGFQTEADFAAEKRVRGKLSLAKNLYLKYDSLSPTTLETYFSCPYLGFIRQGLRAEERVEGSLRTTDTGNFVHAVLQDLAEKIADFSTLEDFTECAKALAEEKLQKPPYSALTESDSGKYLSGELVAEAVKISAGMYEQIANSKFTVASAESKCTVNLDCGVKIYGRIDRVDTCGDMVRIVDYKTGSFSAAPADYYMGAKLQLPLYLLSAAKDKRAVGAYYFPAAVEYKEARDGVFRLQGFMDGSEDVLYSTDVNLQVGKRSEYVSAGIGVKGKTPDAVMKREDFGDFLEYSRIVADTAVREMLGGNIQPSPKSQVCDYCKAGGSCNFAVGYDGEARDKSSVQCAKIAALVRGLRNGGQNE